MNTWLAAVASTAIVLYTCEAMSNLHPIILVPGSGGNQLEARLTSEYKPSSLVCNRWYPPVKQKGGWFRLWFDPSVLLAPFTKCFSDRMMLYYDEQADDYRNAPGVQTRVTHFGSLDSLLYLNPHLQSVTEYMAPLVKSLQRIGYVKGQTLFGAPYDFRYGLAAEGHPSKVGSKFLGDLKLLIEQASELNGGKQVIVLSHSLGGKFVLQLLDRNPISWRKKFVKHFIALSAPWGGTVDMMRTFASGNTLGVPLVDPLLVRGQQRTSECNLWLLPNPKVFGSNPLVMTPLASYSAHEIASFLGDIGFPEGVKPYETRILPLIEKFVAPEVPITCVIGSGVKTAESLVYGENGFDRQPEIVYGDGDGTVGIESLLALESLWVGNKNQSIRVVKLEGISHTSVLTKEAALEKIIAEISTINSDVLNKMMHK